jgi:hypothetical protein
MKIKTFAFEDNYTFSYDSKYGKHCYISNVKRIDDMINDFINSNEKDIEIIDIKINSIIVGNNPPIKTPTSILIYTLIYKEMN